MKRKQTLSGSEKPLSPGAVFVVSDRVLRQEVGGETVLLDLASEQYFGLDTVGTRILQLVDSGLSLEEIKVRIGAEFEASSEQIERDLEHLIVQLTDAGLIAVLD